MPSADFEKKMKKLNLTELKLKYHELDDISDKLIDKEEELRNERDRNEDDKWFVFSLITKKDKKYLS
jgi:hypothetical protein